MTVDQFVTWDGDPGRHYELVDGRVRLMPIEPPIHGALLVTLGGLVGGIGDHHHLFSCIRVGVRIPGRDDAFYAPDLSMSAPPLRKDALWLDRPVLVAEVLSAESRTHDLGNKVPHYMLVPSIQDILLIDSNRRHVQHRRRRDGDWIVRDLIGDGAITPAALEGGSITLEEIYGGVL